MGKMCSFVLGLVLLAGSGLAPAQGALWSVQVSGTNSARIARDSASNIFLITRSAVFGGRSMEVRKFNALGDLQWMRFVEGTYGPYDLQYSIVESVVQGDKLYFARNLKNGGGSGATQNSKVYALNTSDGSEVFSNLSTADITGIAVSPDYLVCAGRNIAGDFVTVHYDSEVGNMVTNRTGGPAAAVHDVCISSNGTAYLTLSRADGTTAIIASPVSGPSATVNFDDPTRTNEIMYRIVLDEPGNRVYAMGEADFSPTDKDAIVYAANADLTSPTLVGFGGGSNDYAGGISVPPTGGGLILSYLSTSTSGMIVRRLSPTLGATWTNNWPSNQGRLCNHAYDIEGSPMILDFFDAQHHYRSTKLNAATGAVLTRLYNTLLGGLPQELVSDPAGNAYINLDESGTSVRLARLQPAKLDLAQTLVAGATTVSASLTNLRSGISAETWNLSSSNTSVATVPASVVLQPNGVANFNITTTPVATNTNVTIVARFSGHILQKTLTVFTPTVSNLTVTPNVVVGGNNATGTVNINGKAPIGGKVVSLSSSLPAAATTPATTTISAGSTGRTFIVTTFGVTANKGVVITATTGAVSKTFFMAVNAPSLTTFTVSPTSVKGGLPSTLTVGLNGKAPTGGWKVLTFSGSTSFVNVPADVTVPVGQSSATANLTTSPVSSTVPVTIFGTRSGIYRTVTLTLTP